MLRGDAAPTHRHAARRSPTQARLRGATVDQRRPGTIPGKVPAAATLWARLRRDLVLTATLVGIVLALAVAFIYGVYKPKTPWAFDRPEAQMHQPQQRHTLYR